VPARASHIPRSDERTALQKLQAVPVGLTISKLHPVGRQTVAGMLTKGWIVKHVGIREGTLYRITPAGEVALRAKIPEKAGREG
jgi:hypothetical protein